MSCKAGMIFVKKCPSWNDRANSLLVSFKRMGEGNGLFIIDFPLQTGYIHKGGKLQDKLPVSAAVRGKCLPAIAMTGCFVTSKEGVRRV
jgi:hypothetical protein